MPPTINHEAVVLLLRERPALIPELLRTWLQVDLPPFAAVTLSDSSFTQVSPTEYRADLTVVLSDEKQVPVTAIVVEVQLSRDPEKRYSWPVYGATLFARMRCPVYLLVVTPDGSVAEWARRVTEENRVKTLVLGPRNVPVIVDPDTPDAELAVLSVIAHAGDDNILEIALAAIAAASRLSDERAALYNDLVWRAVSAAVRESLERAMEMKDYEFVSEFARKHIAIGRNEGRNEGRDEGRNEGRNQGRAESVLSILAERGLPVSDDLRARLLACQDGDILDRWLRRALTAKSAEEVVN